MKSAPIPQMPEEKLIHRIAGNLARDLRTESEETRTNALNDIQNDEDETVAWIASNLPDWTMVEMMDMKESVRVSNPEHTAKQIFVELKKMLVKELASVPISKHV
ncbi:MAG: hypothetical protein WCF94_00945 [bacterium]